MHVRADDRLPCPPASVVETAELAGEVAVSGDPREPYGRIVHEQRRAWVAGQPGKFYAVVWEDRDEGQRELDRRIGEAVMAAERERIARLLDAMAAGSGGQSRHALRNAAQQVRSGAHVLLLGKELGAAGGEDQERTDEKGAGDG